MIEILDRREFQIHHDDFIAWAMKVETGSNDGLRKRDVLVQRNLAGQRSDQRRDLIADADGHFPPAFFPGTNAALSPGIGVAAHGIVNASRHGPERVGDQVRGTIQNGEFAAPFKKVTHYGVLAI